MRQALKLAVVATLVTAFAIGCGKKPMESDQFSPSAIAANSNFKDSADITAIGGNGQASGKETAVDYLPQQPPNASVDSGDSQTQRAADARKIIRNGTIALTVDDYETTKTGIDKMLAQCGGFIANVTVQHRAGKTSHADITLRIPAQHFETVVNGVGALGTVTHESIATEDITEQYFDVKSRLENGRRLEKRLLDLLEGRTDKLTDILQVERELARVRETLEVMEGRLRLYDNLVGLSTLILTIDVRTIYTPQTPAGFGDEVGNAFAASWTSFVGFLRDASLFFARNSIQLVIWLLVIFVAWRLILRVYRLRKLVAAAPPPPAKT